MRRLFTFLFSLYIGILAAESFEPDPSAKLRSVAIRGTNLIVEAQKTHAHLFLAEYDFKLILRVGSEQVDAVDMSGDTGGRSRIEVLRLSSGQIAFRDHAKAECLKVTEEKFRYCEISEAATRIGYFDFDAERTWRFISREPTDA